jgi:hypothetical protein
MKRIFEGLFEPEPKHLLLVVNDVFNREANGIQELCELKKHVCMRNVVGRVRHHVAATTPKLRQRSAPRSPRLANFGDDLLGGIAQIDGRNDRQARILEDFLAQVDIGAFKPDHQRD